MGLIEINRNPSRRDLAWFGAVLALFLVVVGLIVRFRFGAHGAANAIWIAAAALAALYYALPPLRRPLWIGWMTIAFPIGWAISHLILALLYYLLFMPIGLAMRLVGHDPLTRRFEPDRATYWVEHRPGENRSRYFRQF